MKNLKLPILFILLCISKASAVNPIVQTIYTADPAPLVYNDRVYVYTSHDEDVLENNFFTMKEWRCYSSEDMVNWTDHGAAASLESFSWGPDNGAWAPQAQYRNGKFYLYCPLHMRGIGVLVSDHPEGPFTDPLGRPLINNSMADIDPTVFIDDDGQAYMYWGNPDLYYVRLNEDMISYSGGIEQIPLTVSGFGQRRDDERPTSYEEGPWFYKRDNLYYMVFAGGPISEHIAYSTSPGPTGPWTYGGVIMPTQGGSFTNHPGVIDFAGNSYLFYHNAALPGGGGFNRSVCVEQFEYGSDGSIPTINMTETGASQVMYLNPFDTIQAETICWESGVETAVCSEGGMMVTDISDGDYIRLQGVDFADGAFSFTARAASGSSGGLIELHLGSRDGPLVGTCSVSGTGGWDRWEDFECVITDCEGVSDLYLVFRGTGDLFNLNWYSFIGASGVSLSVTTRGRGTVTRTPSEDRYEYDSEVTLTATALEGWVFDHWTGDVQGTENPLTIVMNASRDITAHFLTEDGCQDLIENGTFSAGADFWTFNNWSGSGTGSVIDGEYRLAVGETGDNYYDIQVVQPGILLEQGKTYRLVYDAYASSQRVLNVNVGMPVDPYTTFLSKVIDGDIEVNLTTTKRTYSLDFTMEEPTYEDSRVEFSVGTGTPTVFVDNVYLYEIKQVPTAAAAVFSSKAQQMSIYKKSGMVTVRIPDASHGHTSLHVYDLKGSMVFSQKFDEPAGGGRACSFDVIGMPKGYYLLKVVSGDVVMRSGLVLSNR